MRQRVREHGHGGLVLPEQGTARRASGREVLFHLADRVRVEGAQCVQAQVLFQLLVVHLIA